MKEAALVMESCRELHLLCLFETNPLTECKQGTGRYWTGLIACREITSMSNSFNSRETGGGQKGGMQQK